MELEFWWLFLGVPAVFALGWWASRADLRQWKREQEDAPRAYFKGLNFLLNEQQDKAIDAFIEAVQNDPDTAELHFALGNLFRRRGEYERAVRVHQHLLGRADLPRADRDRAQYALAQDYLKAGLMDRAEEAFGALEKVPAYAAEARMALIALYERAHDWPKAIEVASALEASGAGSFAARRAHYHCELAMAAQAAGRDEESLRELEKARADSPTSPRPYIELARRDVRHGAVDAAFGRWADLARVAPQALPLVAAEIAELGNTGSTQVAEGGAPLAQGGPWHEAATAILEPAYARDASLDVLSALVAMEPDAARRHARLLAHLERQPSTVAASELLAPAAPEGFERERVALKRTMDHAARPLNRYRCAACGFESGHYFWQCPGCQTWDSYPPKRIEEY